MTDQPRIVDRCPTCGSQSLFIGTGGYLTCSVIGCKEPGVGVAITKMQSRLSEIADIVQEIRLRSSDVVAINQAIKVIKLAKGEQ